LGHRISRSLVVFQQGVHQVKFGKPPGSAVRLDRDAATLLELFSRAELKMAMFLSRRVLCTASWRVWLKKLILLYGDMLSDPRLIRNISS